MYIYIYFYILSISFFLQIQELRLQYQYNHDRGNYHYLPKFMEDKIQPIFEQLRFQTTTDLLKQFIKYISETWIQSITWPPSSWSVCMIRLA